MYKVYSNDMFDNLDQSGAGGRFGDICVAAPGCCDGVTLQSNEPSNLKSLASKYYSRLHRYILQTQKTVTCD